MSEKVREALDRLANAADVYGADQSSVGDPRSGNVQPITAEQGNELNEALAIAWAALAEPDVCVYTPKVSTLHPDKDGWGIYITACGHETFANPYEGDGSSWMYCPFSGCGKRIEVRE